MRFFASRALIAGAIVLAGPARGEVIIEGIEGEVLENAFAFLDIDDLACDAPSRRVGQALEGVPEDIASSLEVYGYYAATVDVSFEQGEECFDVTIRVTSGRQVMFRNVDLEVSGEAAQDPAFDSRVNQSAVVSGQPLSHAAYDSLKRGLQTVAAQRGYIQAAFDASRIDVYPDELAADVELRFDSGPRFVFGELRIDSDVLREELIASYLGYEPGDAYSSQAVADFQIALRDSGYFDLVDVEPLEADPETRSIPILVSLEPAPRKLLTYGVGFSTDTGPRLRFGRNIRRFNDRGHQLGVRTQLSPVVSEFAADYRMPRGDPRKEWLSFDAGMKREDTETSDSRSLELGARRVIDLGNDWTRTQLLRLLVEDFEISDQIERSRFLMPGVEWLRLRADNSIRPTRGHRLNFELRVAVDDLVSDTSFLQGLVGGKIIRTVPGGGRVLFRGRLGTTWVDSFRLLPPSVRFFAGGDSSVRGYEFESLGPVDEDGEVIGGSRIVTSSIEYEHPVLARWSVAAFADTGNAFEKAENIDLMSGIGIGARWQSPLGPIRIDVAKPLDGLDRGLRLHISLGPDL